MVKQFGADLPHQIRRGLQNKEKIWPLVRQSFHKLERFSSLESGKHCCTPKRKDVLPVPTQSLKEFPVETSKELFIGIGTYFEDLLITLGKRILNLMSKSNLMTWQSL